MGSLYYDYWSCTNCSYSSSSILAPFSVFPKSGVLKSKTEYRWCDDCNKIQICFLGIGDEYDPDSSDMPTNLKRKTYLSESDLILKIKDLESFKSGFFFFLTKRARKLRFYKKELSSLRDLEKLSKKLSIKAFKYYSSLKPKPKCLMCGSVSVSKSNWKKDKHFCGGRFQRKGERLGATTTSRNIKYDEYGNSTLSAYDYNTGKPENW